MSMELTIIKSSPIAISPQKMNLVAGLIRKKKLDYSLDLLSFLPKKGGRILYKLLQGMAKNLEKEKLETRNFYLTKIEVNQGKIQKRIMYRAKGRADRRRKRYCLVNLYLAKNLEKEKLEPKLNIEKETKSKTIKQNKG